MDPELSIIIVSYKVREYLLNCIQSICDTTDGVRFEIIVVDNASGDGSAEAVKERFPTVQVVVNNRNIGFAAANNQALSVAKGDMLLLANPDVVVKEAAIPEMLDFVKENQDVAVAGCRLVHPDGTPQQSIRAFPSVLGNLFCGVQLGTSLLRGACRPSRPNMRAIEAEYLNGAFLMVRRGALDGQPLFDPAFFMYGEEKDLCWRVKKRGWRVCFLPQVQVTHYGGRSARSLPVSSFIELQRSQLVFFAKHHNVTCAWSLALSWAFVLASTLLSSLAVQSFGRGDTCRSQDRALLFWAALRWYLGNMSCYLRKK